jgi:hypothetical protein
MQNASVSLVVKAGGHGLVQKMRPWIGAKQGPPFVPKVGPRNGVRQGCENEELVTAKYSKTLSTKTREPGRKNIAGRPA